MKSLYRWFFPTEDQKKEKFKKRIRNINSDQSSGYDLNNKSLQELERIYILELHKSYGYEFVSFRNINFTELEQRRTDIGSEDENAKLEANSIKYYKLPWYKKIFFRIKQLAALHTTGPNKISMLSVIALAILCYVVTTVPSIFGYGIYPIMLFLTVPLIKHVSLVKWHVLFDNDKARSPEILIPILFGINLITLGATAKIIGAISIPLLTNNVLIPAVSILCLLCIAHMVYSAYSNKFDLLAFMTSGYILSLSLMAIAPIFLSHISLIANFSLFIGLFLLCYGLYNLYEEDTNKFWTLLFGLGIVGSTIILSASLLNASFLFMLSPYLTYEMIASSFSIGVLSTIGLYGTTSQEMKDSLKVTAKDLKNSTSCGVNFNLIHLGFWNMLGHMARVILGAGKFLAYNCWSMITGTFSRGNITKVANGAAGICSSALNSCYKTFTGTFSSRQEGNTSELEPLKQ